MALNRYVLTSIVTVVVELGERLCRPMQARWPPPGPPAALPFARRVRAGPHHRGAHPRLMGRLATRTLRDPSCARAAGRIQLLSGGYERRRRPVSSL